METILYRTANSNLPYNCGLDQQANDTISERIFEAFNQDRTSWSDLSTIIN
ncbi:MAG: hypothetical protein WCJ58_05650 [bacterium]